MTKAYILTVFVYNGTVLIKHQAYAFTNKALAEHTRDRLKELNKSNKNQFRIAYSVEEAPVYNTIEQVPMFQDYQPVTNNDAPAQPDNAPAQEPTDTAETSITDEEALSHLETFVQDQEQTDNAVSTAASSTTELTTEADEQKASEVKSQEPAKSQEQKPKSVRKITFKKTAGKTKKK